ncbi:sugar transferase, partial [Thermodesulfobacteriota bacterium]
MHSVGVTFYERVTGKILVEKTDPSWIIFSDGFSISRIRSFIKRFFDLAISVSLFALTLPVMLLTVLIVKLETPGPILYRQVRVGMNRQNFEVIKFRSMVADAEKNGPVWATENDDRVTRFGSFIRKTRIDELPQLINVLR